MTRTVVGGGGTAPVFGRIPHPPYERRIVDKPSSNPATRGFDWLGSRLGQIVGTCVHRMDGTLIGSEHHFRNPAGGALTDYGIGGALDGDLDGVIFLWNDPEGQRSPWASGWGPEGPGVEGDGRAFLDAYPEPGAVNKRLVSIELSGLIDRPGQADTPVTERQLDSLCLLIAYWHDRAGVPWDLFPSHPASGVVTQLQHHEFTRKGCPGTLLRGLTTTYQERVRGIMRGHQTARLPPSAPGRPHPPGLGPTPTPALELPPGVDEGMVRAWFGEVVLAGVRYRFDGHGPVSRAWLAEGRRTGWFPRLVAVETRGLAGAGNTRSFRFEGGLTILAAADGHARVARA